MPPPSLSPPLQKCERDCFISSGSVLVGPIGLRGERRGLNTCYGDCSVKSMMKSTELAPLSSSSLGEGLYCWLYRYSMYVCTFWSDQVLTGQARSIGHGEVAYTG
jgi:hypothetical protein